MRKNASTNKPVVVTVALLTYLRPDDLAAGLPLVLEQAKDAESMPVSGLWHKVRVLVVDNDPAGSAAAFGGRAPGVLSWHEPLPVIARAHNRALDEVGGSNLLVFLDDDEWSRPGRLFHASLRTRSQTAAALLAVRVIFKFEVEPDAWAVGSFFSRRTAAAGSPFIVPAGSSLLDLSVARDAVVRFDPRFGLSGGGETSFTRTLHACGAKMVWCNEAVVTDVVSAERITRRAVLRPAMSMGTEWNQTGLEIPVVHWTRLLAQVRGAGRGAVRMVGGTDLALVAHLIRSSKVVARSSRTDARFLGAAAFGHGNEPYARKHLNKQKLRSCV